MFGDAVVALANSALPLEVKAALIERILRGASRAERHEVRDRFLRMAAAKIAGTPFAVARALRRRLVVLGSIPRPPYIDCGTHDGQLTLALTFARRVPSAKTVERTLIRAAQRQN